MPMFTVRIYKSYGGRSDRNQSSNTYDINLEAAISSPEMLARVNKLVTAEAGLFPTSVNFMRAVVSTFAQEGRVPYNPEGFKVFELNRTGDRPIPQGVDIMPVEVAGVFKHNVAFGRSGRQTYKGMFLESDIVTSPGGVITSTVNPQVFNQQWEAYYQQNGGTLDIATRDQAGNFSTRAVISTVFSGVTVAKRTRRRKKKIVASESTLAPLLSDTLQVLAEIAAVVFTRGKALPILERGALAAIAGSIASTTGTIIGELTDGA
jgi:hypothetical protein